MQIGKIMKDRGRNNRGFTMIELIAVLIIVGIIAAVAAVRMSGTSAYDLASQLEVVKAHLRLAQSRAMSSGIPCGINFSTTKTYYLFMGDGSTTPVLLLGEDNTTVNLTTKKSDLAINTVNLSAPPQRITFDAYGSPGVADVTVATSGGNFIVRKNTGFID